VLSINKSNNTIDIISGGIVKNLTLSGKDDYDNFENIIQREVEKYKNEENAIGATTINSNNLDLVISNEKNIISPYFILKKDIYTGDESSYDFKSLHEYYNVGIVMYPYDLNRDEMGITKWITLSERYAGGEVVQEIYKNGNREYSYTAGLRPVITLKLDSVEKLSEEETKRIEESTEKQEKIYIKEQETKNKDYKGPSKVDDSTSSTGNNNEVKSNDNDNTKDNITDNNTSNVEKIVYRDKPFYKYGFYILLVICLIETLMLIIPKINKK
jgi:hypothetical protein